MTPSLRLLAVAAILTLGFAAEARCQNPGNLSETLPLGTPFPGVIKAESYVGLNDLSGYTAQHKVRLRAEQSVNVLVTVTGDERMVGAALLDPAGAVIKTSGMSKKSANFRVNEISDDGDFTVVVKSPTIGKFNLLVMVDGQAAPTTQVDAAALERRVQVLERELEAIKAELRTLRNKIN